MTADTVRVDAIRVEDRARTEYRNIDSLAGSIATLGLLHPPVVTADLRLIAGGRRLEAVKALGWEVVAVTVADDLTEAAAILQAESDENAEREALTLSESSALARRIEDALRPLARERMEAGGNLPQGEKTRDIAAKAAGVSATTIRKVRHVEEVIESEMTPEPVREIAVEALAEMNATGKADAGHKAVKAAVTASELVAQFPDLGYYFDLGDHATVLRLGNALKAYQEPELSMRINNLRLDIEMKQNRTSEPVSNEPDWQKHADTIFTAFNDAMQVFEKNGGSEAFEKAMATANPLSVELWRSTFNRIIDAATVVDAATAPRLRAV